MTKTGRLSIILTDFEIIKLLTPTYNLFFIATVKINILRHDMIILYQPVVPTRRYCTLSPSPVLLAASVVTGDLSSYGSPAAPALRYLLAIR